MLCKKKEKEKKPSLDFFILKKPTSNSKRTKKNHHPLLHLPQQRYKSHMQSTHALRAKEPSIWESSISPRKFHTQSVKKKTSNSGKIGIYNARYTWVQADSIIQTLLLQLLKRISFNFYNDINLSKDTSVWELLLNPHDREILRLRRTELSAFCAFSYYA